MSLLLEALMVLGGTGALAYVIHRFRASAAVKADVAAVKADAAATKAKVDTVVSKVEAAVGEVKKHLDDLHK